MYYKAFDVQGFINVTTYDAGLVSLVEEPYHVDAILITQDAAADNLLECWIGNERLLEIPDYLLDTIEEAAVAGRSTTKLNRIPVDMDIPPGQIFRAAIRCGGTASRIYGAYEYTKTGA